MKIRNLKIGAQLVIGFSMIMIFVLAIAMVSYRQTRIIQEQVSTLYNHPLQVRRAIGDIQNNITLMRLSMRDLMLATNKAEQIKALSDMDLSSQIVEKEFHQLYDYYLGPRINLDEAHEAFIRWNSMRQENINYALQNENEKVKESVDSKGNVGSQREVMLQKINVISGFAQNKSDELYRESERINSQLTIQLIVIIVICILLSFVIIFILISGIQRPLRSLTTVINAFRDGDLQIRSKIKNKNEMGLLADSFNQMMDTITEDFELNRKTGLLADSMLIEDDSHAFFRELLPVLMDQTNSQIAAVYILNEAKTKYEHYDSVGLALNNKKLFFSATGFDGEFGKVLLTKSIQYINNIPKDTTFIYHTVSGDLIPRVIVTIPVKVGDEVIAILSLAAVRKYSDQTIRLIDRIYDALSARIDGVLAYRTLRKSLKLIESQKNELQSQSTELARQNFELENQKNQLKEVSQLKTIFLSNMSHELRTPLNSVIALSGVLSRRLEGKIQEEEYSFIEVIERNGKHLLSLINNILDLSRIEAGREDVEVIEFNPDETVMEIITMIRTEADQKGISLYYTSPEPGIKMNSDPLKFRQILQNLIGNAVKFTEFGNVEIKINLCNDGGSICVEVADTGIGINKEHLSSIFDEFRQADGSTSRRFGGTGLGLSIARKFANLMGGEITVSSVPDKGSVFTLILPLQLIDSQQYISSPVANNFTLNNSTSEEINGEGKTILIVDDSLPALIQVRDFLEVSGFDVITAYSGEEALQLVREVMPDGIILDLMMPGVDGFEVLKRIRNNEITSDIPVLILTAKHLDKTDLAFLRKNNVHQLIQKGSVNKSQLLNAVFQMSKN